MEVILLSDVEHVGLRGDVVSVARGYARNYLLPRRLAEEATPSLVAELQKRDTLRARHEAKTAEQANEIAELLTKTVLRFEVKAGPTGSLFGSVTPTDIADELWDSKKVRVDRRKIETDPIKRIGRYEVPIALFEDVRVEVKTEVVPEGGELPSDEELAELEAAERAEQESAEPEPSVEIEEILAEVDAAEAAEHGRSRSESGADAEAEPRDRARVASRRRRGPRQRVKGSRDIHTPSTAVWISQESPARSASSIPRCAVRRACNDGCFSCKWPKTTCSQGTFPHLESRAKACWNRHACRSRLLRRPPSPAPSRPRISKPRSRVLGAMMISGIAIAAVSEILDASDFYRESHAKIYRAALQLYGKNEPVDAITLTNELEQRGELEEIGGRVRLHELARIVPATANAGHYAEIVRETATLRGLILAGGRIAQLGWDREGEPTELVARAEQLVFELGERRAEGELVLFKDTLVETFQRISHLYESGAEVTGLTSGFKDLDRITAGFQPANLVILAARPSMGKSAFALEIASHVAVDEQHAVRLLQPRDVAAGGRPAPDLLARQGRRAPHPHRQALEGRLAARSPRHAACSSRRRSTSTTRRA